MFKRQDPSKLQAQLSALKGSNNGFTKDDPKEWKLKTNAEGNGEALIRFLPAKTDDGLPFVKLVNHGFRNNGKWYINNCSSTHGDFDSCPVCKYINENDLYNSNKSEWQNLKRKTSYWANILVLKDPQCPDNNGKVFKFRFGQKIYDKILAMSNVNTDMGEIPVNVVCPFEGANFILKAKKVDKHQNYDDSRFMQQSAIPRIDEEEFQKFLMDNMEPLEEINSKDKFKPFDELEKQFKQVMGVSLVAGSAATNAAAAINSQLDDFDAQMASFNAESTKTPAASASTDELLGDMGLDFDLSGSSASGDGMDLEDLLNM